MNKNIEYFKEQKNELIEINKKIEKYEKQSKNLERQLKKYKRREFNIEKQLEKDRASIKQLKNYNKIISLEKKKRILKATAYSLIVTSTTMIAQIISKNLLAGVPLHTTVLCFGMIEGMLYVNNTRDIKKLKKETDINKLKEKIKTFENEYQLNKEKINSITEIKNRYFDKLNDGKKKINNISKALIGEGNNNIIEFDQNKLTK